MQISPWPSRPPHAYLVAAPPPWPELVSYIRKLVFQSSSLPPLDRSFTPLDRSFSPLDRFLLRSVDIVISAARVARCAIQHSVSYCVKIKVYASIQRVSEQFPNCSLVNKFPEKSVDVLEVVNFRQQLRRQVLSLAITVVGLRRRCVYSLAGLAGACRRFVRRHDRPSLVGQCYFVATTFAQFRAYLYPSHSIKLYAACNRIN